MWGRGNFGRRDFGHKLRLCSLNNNNYYYAKNNSHNKKECNILGVEVGGKKQRRWIPLHSAERGALFWSVWLPEVQVFANFHRLQ